MEVMSNTNNIHVDNPQDKDPLGNPNVGGRILKCIF
jgi:hypothetical protein